MRYVAIINTPGYLPQDDEPPTFDTPEAAWRYLHEMRCIDEDYSYAPDNDVPPYSETVKHLADTASVAAGAALGLAEWDGIGSVVGNTPGYEGSHDLGIVYSVVRAVESDEDNSEGE